MDKNLEKSEKKPNWKKRIVVIIFILFNAAVILWTALSEFANKDNATKLSSVEINFWLLLPALILFVIALTSEISKYFLMMKKCCKRKDWRTAGRTVILGRYYDNITPAAVGGQPFQMYYLNKQGIKDGYSIIIPVIGLISTQIAFILIATLSFIFFGNNLSDVLLGGGWLGLVFYAIFPIGIILALFFPDLVSKIVSAIVKFLSKIHIIKDEGKTLEKVDAEIKKYTSCLHIIIKNKKLSLAVLALSMLFHICVSCIPFFVLKAFGGEINFFTCFATIIAITSAIYFVPTPGNAGAAEGSFFFVFSSLTSGYVFWAMLFWRFFNFYSYILLGIIIYAIMAYEKKTGHHPFFTLRKWLKSKFQKT